jgi:hypothetical protein
MLAFFVTVERLWCPAVNVTRWAHCCLDKWAKVGMEALEMSVEVEYVTCLLFAVAKPTLQTTTLKL